MAEELTRAFKGIWIPAEIWLSQDLTMTDKIIYAEIDSFCSNKKPCYAGNKHFAQLIGISENRVSHIIAKLVEMGYVHRDITYREDGKTIDKRLLSITRGYCYPQQGGIVADNKDTNTYTNTNNNIYSRETRQSVSAEFVKEVVDYLNEKTGKNYKASTTKTKRCISARWREGYTDIEDYKKVIDTKYATWSNDVKMYQYLRPETLFGSKFEGYLNEVVQTQAQPQRPSIRSTLPDMTEEETERLRREMYGDT